TKAGQMVATISRPRRIGKVTGPITASDKIPTQERLLKWERHIGSLDQRAKQITAIGPLAIPRIQGSKATSGISSLQKKLGESQAARIGIQSQIRSPVMPTIQIN